MLVLASPIARAGTLEDMELRSNVETLIRGTAPTANLHLKILVENRVAIPEGVVRDLNQADDVVVLAAKVRGILSVDRSKLRLEYPPPADDQLAGRVARTLVALPRYDALAVTAADGVVTLSGPIKNASWRGEIRRICGAIEGVAELVDRIETPATADERIQKALNAVFGPRVVPRFPGKVRAVAADGVVTLEGRVPRLYDKQAAEKGAWGLNGVHRVDNRLELGSGTSIHVIDP
jgi:osmotically-inducible protein OsmY